MIPTQKENIAAFAFFKDLPLELKIEIFSQVNIKTLGRIAQTNQENKAIVKKIMQKKLEDYYREIEMLLQNTKDTLTTTLPERKPDIKSTL